MTRLSFFRNCGRVESDEEGSGGDSDSCWNEQCHPLSRIADSVDCNACPNRDPRTWRQEDVQLDVSCRKDSARVIFNLDNVKSVGWMSGLSVKLTYTHKAVEKQIFLTDLDISNRERVVFDLKPGSKYDFCLNFMVDTDGGHAKAKGFCKVNRM